jgi:hypothetical protein
MKITPETKLKKLIPEGYQIDYSIQYEVAQLKDSIMIQIKKKEVKNFDWYAQKYFNKINKKYNIELVIDSNFEDVVFPFEFKIGLLKFICDDIDVNFFTIIDQLNNKKYSINSIEVSDICPKEFLESIF